MSILGWIVRVILFLIVIRLVVRFLAGLLQGLIGAQPQRPMGPGRAASRTQAVALVKDPVCGTYVVAEKALTLVARGTTHYFCSDKCRLSFERSHGASRSA